MTTTRVVQWATGTTGRLALRAVIDSPTLDLVGVRVYDPQKVGVDAGDLAGRETTGIRATAHVEDLFELRPDVVLYMGSVERHPDSCFAEVAAILASGADVIATGSSFTDVAASDPPRARDLQDACRTGSSTFLGLGLFPGFWGEAIVPILSRLSGHCSCVTIRESLCYAGYPSRELLVDVMGYGRAADSTEPLFSNPTHAGNAFVGTASVIAKALGQTVESLEPFRETALTPTDLHVRSGVITAGTVAAMKLGLRARCGAITIVVEHVTWMDPDVAPHWSGSEGYQIEFDGAPTMRVQLALGTQGEDHTEMGCLATAMHAVHAIPAVVSAPPGVLDLAAVSGFVGALHSPM